LMPPDPGRRQHGLRAVAVTRLWHRRRTGPQHSRLL
jgi:hypothetical protein